MWNGNSLSFAAAGLLVLTGAGPATAAPPLSLAAEAGKAIFFDTDLSINANQACAACHAPESGWTGPDSAINAGGAVYEGSVAGRFGNRKPPSSAYATPSPILHAVISKKEALFIGGNFWDGRATGEKLGNPAADQAQGPFLNPVEQALRDSACVVYRVCTASYADDFKSAYPGSCTITWPASIATDCAAGSPIDMMGERAKVSAAYDNVALAIAAYEGSPEVNQFSSKYDAWQAGLVDLTQQEKLGFNLFKGKAQCSNCHVLEDKKAGTPALFTDFTFDNIGVPRNPDNPWYDQAFNPLGDKWIDLGLGEFLYNRVDYRRYAEENYGKQKVPTLRNVDKRAYPGFEKAFMHNGYFKSLEAVVDFYNTRDVKKTCISPFTSEQEALAQNCWPAPEVPQNVNTDELGNLHLTDQQEAAIVAFLKTLSDGFIPPAKGKP